MENKFNILLNQVQVAKDVLEYAENQRDKFLQPILKELKVTGGGISWCSVSGNNLYIRKSGSCRGCSWDDDTFPLSIFTSDNPIESARLYMENCEKEKKDRKLEELQRLQKGTI